MTDPTNAARKHRMRQKRKDAGMVEVRLWLHPDYQRALSHLVRQAERDGDDIANTREAIEWLINDYINRENL